MPWRLASTSRAVSPVISTVILVAIAVVLAVALGSYSGSLFNVYTKVPQTKFVNATFSSSAKTVTIYFSNSGAISDNITSVTVPLASTTLTATGSSLNPNPALLPPGQTTKIVATFTGTMPSAGVQVTLISSTRGGQQYTESIPVTS